ncbi:MAG: hypothetical protein VXX30_01055, partial [Planctomycetota bacterium]|nr:hypothetical protein [Planctomycetota bacterium]
MARTLVRVEGMGMDGVLFCGMIFGEPASLAPFTGHWTTGSREPQGTAPGIRIVCWRGGGS